MPPRKPYPPLSTEQRALNLARVEKALAVIEATPDWRARSKMRASTKAVTAKEKRAA